MTGGVRYGIPNINDTQTITEMVASGAHMIVFTTGAGSVVGQAVAPVIKVVSNSRVFQRLSDDMDINAGTIADGAETIDEVGERIVAKVVEVASGAPTRSEALGHQEFVAELQDLRAARPGLPAGLSVASGSDGGGRLREPARQQRGRSACRSKRRLVAGAAALGVCRLCAARRAPRTMSGCA